MDAILRGEATQMSLLGEGQIGISARELAVIAAGQGAIYGLCMASFTLVRVYAADDVSSAAVTGDGCNCWRGQ